jgi:hypothetical protein
VSARAWSKIDTYTGTKPPGWWDGPGSWPRRRAGPRPRGC